MNRELPIDVRLDRARLAQKFDYWVMKAFLITPFVGIVLTYLKWSSFEGVFYRPWMNVKLIFFGIILIMAVLLVAGAAGTTGILEAIKNKEGDKEKLEKSLRKRVINLAYPAITLHILLAAIIIIALVGNHGDMLVETF
jgi:hypothetical protein|tara:strand:- start:2041 stop:2457 length:417 start_codon:yes stop_codon:yes gene_type:complete